MSKPESSPPIAMVSGASSGIGEAICRQLIDQAYRVVGAARNEDRLQQLAAELGDGFYPLLLDVTDGVAVAGVPQALPQEFRDVEVLVNNAGHDIGGRSLTPGFQLVDGYIANGAVYLDANRNHRFDFLDRNRGEAQPWLLSVNPFDPHPPFDPPWEYYRRYDPDSLPGAHFEEGDLEHQQRLADAGVDFQSEPLPKSGPGKVLKRELREPYWSKSERRIMASGYRPVPPPSA